MTLGARLLRPLACLASSCMRMLARPPSRSTLTRPLGARVFELAFHSLVAIAAHPQDLGRYLGAFDLIVCNQVFEHVKDPFASARGLFHLVKPGGYAFWSAPFLERFHFSYEAGDYFRYTCMGAQEIFTQAGFVITDAKKVGDSHMASAALLGMGVGDIHPAHLRHALISNFTAGRDDRSDKQWLSISCVLVAQRPLATPQLSI